MRPSLAPTEQPTVGNPSTMPTPDVPRFPPGRAPAWWRHPRPPPENWKPTKEMEDAGWQEPKGLWDGSHDYGKSDEAWESPAESGGDGASNTEDTNSYKASDDERPDCWDFDFFDTTSWEDWMEWWQKWDFYWVIDADSYAEIDRQTWYDDVCDDWCTITYNTDAPSMTYDTSADNTYFSYNSATYLSYAGTTDTGSYGLDDSGGDTTDPDGDAGGEDAGEVDESTTTTSVDDGGDEGGDEGGDNAGEAGGDEDGDDGQTYTDTDDDGADTGTQEAANVVLAEADARETIGRLSSAFANARAALLSQ